MCEGGELMKVTIKDIAAIAGVSHSTVSRALNDSPQISTATKDKIKKIAKSMNFEFNAGARSLKGVKTGNIAVVYESYVDQFGSSLYITQLFTELRNILEGMEMDAIILEGYHPDTGVSNIDRLLRQQKVDGFLIVHDQITNRDYQSIEDAGIPLVQLHMRPRFFKAERLNYFFSDNFVGGHLATKHLIDKGCKNILTVIPDEDESLEYRDRTLGYKSALEENGLEFRDEYILKIECSYTKGYNLLKNIPELMKRIDGVFFQTDVQAFGFLNAVKESGIIVPENLKVIGYDDTPVCEYTTPLLSTIHQPKKELALLAASRIMELINKKNVEIPIQKIIKPTLVIRKSS